MWFIPTSSFNAKQACCLEAKELAIISSNWSPNMYTLGSLINVPPSRLIFFSKNFQASPAFKRTLIGPLLDYSFETLMVKSGELFVKIGSRLQIALFFLFYWNVQPLVYSDFPVYLILPNVPTSRFLGLPPPAPPRLSRT